MSQATHKPRWQEGEMSLQGEQEAMDKERREAPEREVMRAACPADKGWVSPLQGCTVLQCPSAS